MELHNVVVKEKVVEQLKKILHENYNKEVDYCTNEELYFALLELVKGMTSLKRMNHGNN